jgi:hypothetical protein
MHRFEAAGTVGAVSPFSQCDTEAHMEEATLVGLGCLTASATKAQLPRCSRTARLSRKLGCFQVRDHQTRLLLVLFVSSGVRGTKGQLPPIHGTVTGPGA